MPVPASPPPPATVSQVASRRRRLVLAASLAVAVLVHLMVLYLPGSQVPSSGVEVPGMDKAIHAAVFALPTLLAVLLGRSAWWGLPFIVHAPVSEWVQHTAVPLRMGDPWDLAADVAGVVLGVLAGRRLLRRGLAAESREEYASRVPPARE